MAVEVDTLNHCVRVDGAAHGKQGRGPGEFHYPSRAAVVGNRVYVADSWNHRVQVFDLPGWKFAFEFGDFFCPSWIGVIDHRDGAVLAIVDTNNARVCFHYLDGRRLAACEFKSRRFPIAARIVDAETLEVHFEDDRVETVSVGEVLRPSWWTTRLVRPISLARDRNGLIYVSDIGRSSVESFDSDGNFIAQVLGSDILHESGRLLINGDDLIVTDRPANAVFIYDITNRTHRKLEFAFDNPGFIGRDPEGRIWIGTYREQPDSRGARFEVFTADYKFVRTVTFAEAQQPTSISFADDRILIADQAARNVLTFLPDLSFSGFLRDRPYDSPVWCVVNDGESHIYVGAGPITDILRAGDLRRLYYVDHENAAVRYREDAPITL